MSDGPVTFGGGRYRVVRVLGEGAQATTFEAVDARVGQAVAVKRFRVRGAKSWKEVELAEREARVLAGLSHPLLPRYVEHFEEGGELFLVTQKIEGESLASLRKRGVTFGEDEVRGLLQDAADALDYLHGQAPPIVHRDLKPGNVIRRPDGSFAFIDFGAVRDRMKPEGGSTVVGTFGYMAPEQFQGRAMPASDVYAVGATALSVLTGQEPEELPHKGLGIDVPAALAGSRVSPALVRALSAMLVPDPDGRATSIAPLLASLSGLSRGDPEGEPRPHGSASLDRFLSGALVMAACIVLPLVGGRVSWRLAMMLVGLALPAVFALAVATAGDPGWFVGRARRWLRGDPPARIRIDAGAAKDSGTDDEAEEDDEEDETRRTRRR